MSKAQKKIGVIVGRFQTPDLHEGHIKLFEHVANQSDQVVVFIGTAPTKLTYNNPLSYEVRELMVNQYLDKIYTEDKLKHFICPIGDHSSDQEWSRRLDLIIGSIIPKSEFDCEVTIYGGRNSFKKRYHGSYLVEEVGFGIDHVSATEIRQDLHRTYQLDRKWREGIIFASANRYPISWQCIDIAVIKRDSQSSRFEVLLAKKKGENGLRFIGGHVDTNDVSLETAARRETMEECNGIETGSYVYLGSARIDDWRYQNEKDKIMTTLFVTTYESGELKPTDDIHWLGWCTVDFDYEDQMVPEHKQLWRMFKQYMSNY